VCVSRLAMSHTKGASSIGNLNEINHGVSCLSVSELPIWVLESVKHYFVSLGESRGASKQIYIFVSSGEAAFLIQKAVIIIIRCRRYPREQGAYLSLIVPALLSEGS
jgi:hypothetical protein